MQYFLYILKSISNNRFYIGQTSNIENRLNLHNNGKVTSTKPYLPWKLVYHEIYSSRSEATKREYFFKAPKGWTTLQNIKKNFEK